MNIKSYTNFELIINFWLLIKVIVYLLVVLRLYKVIYQVCHDRTYNIKACKYQNLVIFQFYKQI